MSKKRNRKVCCWLLAAVSSMFYLLVGVNMLAYVDNTIKPKEQILNWLAGRKYFSTVLLLWLVWPAFLVWWQSWKGER